MNHITKEIVRACRKKLRPHYEVKLLVSSAQEKLQLLIGNIFSCRWFLFHAVELWHFSSLLCELWHPSLFRWREAVLGGVPVLLYGWYPHRCADAGDVLLRRQAADRVSLTFLLDILQLRFPSESLLPVRKRPINQYNKDYLGITFTLVWNLEFVLCSYRKTCWDSTNVESVLSTVTGLKCKLPQQDILQLAFVLEKINI